MNLQVLNPEPTPGIRVLQVESLRGFFEKIQTVEGNVGNQVAQLRGAFGKDSGKGFGL